MTRGPAARITGLNSRVECMEGPTTTFVLQGERKHGTRRGMTKDAKASFGERRLPTSFAQLKESLEGVEEAVWWARLALAAE